MTINDLEQHLRSLYDLKLFCDIGDVTTSPNGLFKILHKIYQPEYKSNQRIVFYTSHLLPEPLVKHVFETLNYIDISNWFVLICGPKDLESSLLTWREKYSSDPIDLAFLPVELISPTRAIDNNCVLPETICAIPWTNLELRPTGEIYPCCLVNNQSLGNIKTTSLDQAFHGERMKRLRASLLAGEKPNDCQQCWEAEKTNLTSIRQHNSKRLKTDFLLKYLDEPQVATLDIKFNNTCNFKCRICGPNSSSLFAQESHKFQKIPLRIQSNWGESTEFINQIGSTLPSLINIDMTGGEPFLLKKLRTLLEMAVDQGHSQNIRLHYNTNGSIWPGSFVDLWPKFKQVDVHFSIDDIGQRFELQRGGRWQDVENNILRLKNLRLPNLTINIRPTISVMNVYYLNDIYDWANEHGFQLYVGYVDSKELDLHNLTQEAKKLIIDKFKDHHWSEIQNIVTTIEQLPNNDGRKFRDKIRYFDSARKENFAESHPEIAQAMKYQYNTMSTDDTN
jgi:radical SAM protein with 4Fe4S-binding SPASM domain